MKHALSKGPRPVAGSAADLVILLDQVAGGDRSAFQALYISTKAKLFGVVLRIIYNQDDAAEVLQEVYLRIWHHAAAYNADKGAPMTWMVAIARNRALDWRRRMRIEVSLDDAPQIEEEADEGPSPLQNAIASDDARQLYECMSELDDHQQRCLMLAYQEGLTHKELAIRLNQPLGTVKSWIRRGLLHLKECLER